MVQIILLLVVIILGVLFYYKKENFDNYDIPHNHHSYLNPTYYKQFYHPQQHKYHDDSYNYGLLGNNKYNYVSLDQFYFNTYLDNFKYNSHCNIQK